MAFRFLVIAFVLLIGLAVGLSGVYTGLRTGHWAWKELMLLALTLLVIYKARSSAPKTNKEES